MLLLPPPLIDRVHHMEALTLMRLLPAQSIDAIITDLPYGTTACSWDQIIPFAPMWAEVKRVLKPRGVLVTTASQPFTSALVMSNPSWFKYSWVWDKGNGSNPALIEFQPFKVHEDICVFCETTPRYFPQMDCGRAYTRASGGTERATMGGGFSRKVITLNEGVRYPRSLLSFSNANQWDKQHSTQKPVALYEYLIKTYTQPGELVLDFCAGSGTTPLACRNTGRRFIAGDQSAEYCAIARDRLRLPFEPREHVKESAPLSDLPLFAAIGD